MTYNRGFLLKKIHFLIYKVIRNTNEYIHNILALFKVLIINSLKYSIFIIIILYKKQCVTILH
jgi:hypothetical protein